MVEQNLRKPFVNIDALIKAIRPSMTEIGNLERRNPIRLRRFSFSFLPWYD